MKHGYRCRILCLLLILVLFSIPVFAAESGTALLPKPHYLFNGVVSEYIDLTLTVQTASGHPLTGAKVALQEPDNFAQVDSNGQVALNDLISGHTYLIIISHSGYATQELNYSYQPQEGNDHLTVTMEPAIYVSQPKQEISDSLFAIPSQDMDFSAASNVIQFSKDDAKDSYEDGRDIQFRFAQGTMELSAFTREEVAQMGNGTYTISQVDGQYELTVTLPQEETDVTRVGIATGMASLALEQGMNVVFQLEELPESGVALTASQLGELTAGDTELYLEYDRRTQKSGLVLGTHGVDGTAMIPAAAFGLCEAQGLKLLVEIYDQDEGQEPWCQWEFHGFDHIPSDAIDLYVAGAPQETDEILIQTQGSWCQYIVTNLRDTLPGKATLHIKKLEDFPEYSELCLYRAHGNGLEMVQGNVQPDEDGWFTVTLQQGDALALVESEIMPTALEETKEETATPSVKLGTGNWFWLLILGGVLLLLILIMLVVILVTRKRSPEKRDPVGHAKTIVDVEWEDIKEDGNDQA